MRSWLVPILAVALVVGSLAGPASAKKPVKHTLFLHGTSQVGELDIPETWLNDAWMKMDSEEPTGSSPKSMFVTNYLTGPNDECSGNGLLPTWKGEVAGTIKGDVLVTLHTLATPASKLSVELYADAVGGCNSPATGAEDYVPPVAEQVVDVPPGHATLEVKFEKLRVKTAANLTLMLHVADSPNPAQVRVLYDSSDFASSVAFTCVKACL